MVFKGEKHKVIAVLIGLLALPAYADVRSQYHKLCGTCHGNNGDGKGRAGASLNPRPTDFGQSKLSRPQMIKVISSGRDGTSMVGYERRLSATEIATMADYILASFVRPPKAGSASAANSPGERIYFEHCAVCHGDRGNTAVWARGGLDPAPRNFTTAAARDELNRERMISSVTHGRPGTAMMSFQQRLSNTEIRAVVDFVRGRFMQHAEKSSGGISTEPPVEKRPAAAAISRAPVSSLKTMGKPGEGSGFPSGMSGDAQKGERFYQQNCFSCHGRSGQGDGPRAHFNQPPPRDFTSEETLQSFDRGRLFESIKTGKKGTVMPAWGKVLSDQQIADVAEYVWQSFIQRKKKSPG